MRFAAQVHTSPNAVTFFVVLDTRVPPFDDVDVRRAMNLAIDRDRVVQIFGGEGAGATHVPAAPAELPGYEPYCPYTMDPGPEEGSWTAPGHRGGPRGSSVVRARPGCGSCSSTRPSFWTCRRRLWGTTWSSCSTSSDTAGA